MAVRVFAADAMIVPGTMNVRGWRAGVTANKPSVLAKQPQADHLLPAAGTSLPSLATKRLRYRAIASRRGLVLAIRLRAPGEANRAAMRLRRGRYDAALFAPTIDNTPTNIARALVCSAAAFMAWIVGVLAKEQRHAFLYKLCETCLAGSAFRPF